MNQQCPYCTGNGYFQLVTGGSETCPSCLGKGHHEQDTVQEEVCLFDIEE